MAPQFHKLSILIVDDTEPMTELIKAVLQRLGIGKIITALNGERAFAVFCRENPDIVITDWHMSPVNGLELAEKIRLSSHSPNRMVPIIMLTGYGAKNRVIKARDLGITEFITKPFNAENLLKRISHTIHAPRDFILNDSFFGPSRRRKTLKNYNGPRRRIND